MTPLAVALLVASLLVVAGQVPFETLEVGELPARVRLAGLGDGRPEVTGIG